MEMQEEKGEQATGVSASCSMPEPVNRLLVARKIVVVDGEFFGRRSRSTSKQKHSVGKHEAVQSTRVRSYDVESQAGQAMPTQVRHVVQYVL
jgi:hypothetical protein